MILENDTENDYCRPLLTLWRELTVES